MAAIADFEWSKFDHIVDVGGAYGTMLASVLETNAAATGILFDLPQVQYHECKSRRWSKAHYSSKTDTAS